MSGRKRKTRPGAGTPGRAMESGSVCETAQPSTQEHTTPAAEGQPFRIADLLHPGAENAISRRDLMALTGRSDRELRLKIEAERRHGIPILSDNMHGYFLPGSQAERERCVKSLRRRAGEIMETAAAIERGGD